jgi:hypothetical protein
MEPVTMLVGALVLGSSEALKDTASQAVRDTYQGLKAAVIHAWQKKAGENEQIAREAEVLISNLEQDPDTFRTPLEKRISSSIPEPSQEIIDKAKSLYELLDRPGFDTGKYNVTIKKAKAVQVGDKSTQTNNF